MLKIKSIRPLMNLTRKKNNFFVYMFIGVVIKLRLVLVFLFDRFAYG